MKFFLNIRMFSYNFLTHGLISFILFFLESMYFRCGPVQIWSSYVHGLEKIMASCVGKEILHGVISHKFDKDLMMGFIMGTELVVFQTVTF